MSSIIMYHFGKIAVTVLFIHSLCASTSWAGNPSFDQNYGVTWGKDHAQNYGSRIQLALDQTSGAGFESKAYYGSGSFEMKIKLPGPDSAGVVTAYYLTSGNSGNHDELDFEFLGNRKGKPYILQTNVFANGKGEREHRIHLWFDPRDNFHTYKVLWNQHIIVFYVDNIPIRYFKNLVEYGVAYPSKAMKITASIWNGEDWATDGGKTKINWSHAPFMANFKGFSIDGCPVGYEGSIQQCNSASYWWNNQRYWALNPTEVEEYQKVKKNYVIYDYCSDKSRYPVPPPECFH